MYRTERISAARGGATILALALLLLSAGGVLAATPGGEPLALLPSFQLDMAAERPAHAGILLAQADVAPDSGGDSLRFEIRTYQVEGNTLLPQEDITRLTARHAGVRRDFGDVQRALEALQELYQARGYAGVLVTLPEQELDKGTVIFRVIEPKIGRVLVEGNEHFSADNARRSVPALVPGSTPNTRAVAGSVKVANENPAKQTAVLLRPGSRDGEVDAVIRVADVPPLRFSVSFDNTGNKETGTYRTGFAFQHGNLFDRDHVLTVQYVTSPKNTNDVEVYGLGYRVPLYSLGDSIDLIVGYSTVDSGTVQNLFDVSGQGAVYAFRYNRNLAKLGDFEHRLVFGADYRAYQNLVTPVGGNFNFVPDITVHPLSLTYSGALRQQQRDLSFYLNYTQNIPGGNDGTGTDFKNSRTEARAAYRMWRFGGVYSREFGKNWQFRVKADAQYSGDALVSAEQFGLGGAESIRGFNERYTSNDRGHRSNWEIYTPDVGAVFGHEDARLRFLAFYDTGQVGRNRKQPGELARVGLDSAGIGARFSYGNHLTIKADFAQVLHDGTQSGTAVGRRYGNRWHLVMGYVF
jgi:hemolysin activation/secretion protein